MSGSMNSSPTGPKENQQDDTPDELLGDAVDFALSREQIDAARERFVTRAREELGLDHDDLERLTRKILRMDNEETRES